MTGHRFRSLIGGLALSCALALPVAAQNFPDRPIRLIVPFGPGGGTDLIARIVAERAGAALGQQMLVENRPGGGATVGIVAMAQSRPDGYTLAVCPPICATAQSLYNPPPFNAERDLAPVISPAELPLVLVVPKSLGVTDAQGLLQRARQARQGLAFASPGAGSSGHLAAEVFHRASGTQMVHVPYRSGAAALTDIVAGRVDFYFDTVASALAQIRAGEVVALGVTGTSRVPQLPDVPTMGEAGVRGFDFPSPRLRVVAPAGTPAPVLARLNAAFQAALADPALQARILEAGGKPAGGTAEETRTELNEEAGRFGRLIREIGITAE
ncbi:Bug family tripartite tricarboxylate transporter substrate binding protein [Rhodovarius lipocyclicus]|uniref:Bug family tripartite tricarboxylate transporter substrate binding protein n=1 Tax=Rhodovarius lipocyclicus TaxID=268410 RepID=UPI0013580624|nr:tripartite tricarboxylate transporter substrate-binding protein [Rhodovarius lipocyclicus]